MNTIFKKTAVKSAIVAGLMLSTVGVQPALAQNSGPVAAGIAVANLDAVIANSNAFTNAEQQRQTTYKAQLDQAEARRQQLNAQIQPLADKFNADREANPNSSALQQQISQIQTIQSNGQAELQRILQPVVMSQAYVQEQIDEKLDEAVKNAMTKNKVTLLLSPQAVLAVSANAYNLNQAILAELNALVPSAQIVPPQGWEPRDVREARAAQSGNGQPAAAGQAAPAAGAQPQGR